MIRALTLWIALPALAGFVYSQVPGAVPSSTPYDVRSWTIRNGLPQSDVTSLAQSSDGSLWIGTFGGLVRFDGLAFEVFDASTTPALKTNRITALREARDGTLWIGTQSAGIARHTKAGFETLALDWGPKGIPSISNLFEDSRGRLWVGNSFGLAYLDGDHVEWIAAVPQSVSSIAEDSSGALWITNWNNLLTLRDGTVSVVATGDYRSVITARDGSLWCGLTRGKVEHRRGDATDAIQLPSEQDVANLLEETSGVIWFEVNPPLCWRNGRIENPCAGPTSTVEARSNGRAALVDQEGSLWFGGPGLQQYRPSPVTGFSSRGIAQSSPRTIGFGPDGSLLVGLYNNYVMRFEHGGFERAPGLEFESMAPSADGSLWLASAKPGLERLTSRQSVARVDDERIVRSDKFALIEDRRKRVWIGVGQVLQRIAGDASRVWKREDGLPGGVVSNLLEPSNGDGMWVASSSGLARIDGDRVAKSWLCGVDLPSGEARALYEDGPFGLWVGLYGGGLCRIDPSGKVHAIGQEQGLAESVVSAIIDDGRGNLVLLGNRTISRVSKRELDELPDGRGARVNTQVFESVPGLDPFEAMGGAMPSYARAPDGSIWFPALFGVVRFDPSVGLEPRSAPTVVFRSLVADGDMLPIDARVSVAPGARNLEISFTASTFVEPERTRFSYRLEPYDVDWVDAGTRRSAIYTRVPSGHYRFQVRSASSDGIWSKADTTLELELEPWINETLWFKFLVGAVALLLTAAIIRVRTLSSRRRAQKLERTVAERTRELQDTRDRLEQMVVERTAELETALRDLKRDMEQREKLEARLRQSEKLEAVGRLAAGIAHDFNNILTAVLGEAEVARDKLESGDLRGLATSEHLTRIENAALRAANLTRQLLAYGRRQVLQPEIVDVNASIREVESMLRRLVRADVALVLELSPDACCVNIDPGQLEQVIVNLVVNARDALDGGGRIVIATSIWRAALDSADDDLPRDGERYVALSVQDNGVGIDEAILGDIFEPFFTTKPQGQGTGMGLASVRAIVEQSKGRIRVSSRRGFGSKFEVLLPEVAQRPAANAAVQNPTETRIEPATILLVDDDLNILDATAQILRRDGHQVLVANRALAALEILRSHEKPIDLVISDIVMPEMSGQALVAKLRALQPTLRVILTSGYSNDDPRADTSDPSAHDFLAKPFKASTLRSRVSACLGRRLDVESGDSIEGSKHTKLRG